MQAADWWIATALASAAAAAAPMPRDLTIPFEGRAYLVTYLEGGKTLAAVCEDGTLRLWDARVGTPKQNQATALKFRGVSRVPGGDRLALVAPGGAVQIWDVGAAAVSSELPAITPRAQRIAVSEGGALIATTHMPDRQASANVIRVRDAAGKDLFTAPAGLGGTSILGFSPDNTTVVAGSWDADLRIWSARNGELLKLIDSLPVAMFAMSFSPDGKLLATAGVDRTVYLWNTKDWRLEKKLTGQKEIISALAFSPDGRRLATGGFDSAAMANPVQLIVWDLAKAKPLRTESMPHAVAGVTFSPDGRQVASFSNKDPFVRVWQAPE